MWPIILDFDASVTLPSARVLDLTNWRQRIRFACSRRTLAELGRIIEAWMPAEFAPVFLGSGDFHHVSYPLIRAVSRRQPCRVIVFDNHPDNMRFPFGIHCGSWVSDVAALACVQHVDVVGITSSDVEARHLWENRWRPLLNGKLTYWCIGKDVRWAQRLGLRRAFRTFASADALVDTFLAEVQATTDRYYLSIDKDVLHPDVARTNWDQGLLSEVDLSQVVGTLAFRLVGMDVTGEVSVAAYTSRWKRWLSGLDRQPAVPVAAVSAWQVEQAAINQRLLQSLGPNPFNLPRSAQ